MRNTIYQDYKIFTGNAHRELAEEISAKLGKSLGKCEVKRFSDGEIAINKMPDIPYTGNHVVERLSTARSFAYDALVRRCRETL